MNKFPISAQSQHFQTDMCRGLNVKSTQNQPTQHRMLLLQYIVQKQQKLSVFSTVNSFFQSVFLQTVLFQTVCLQSDPRLRIKRCAFINILVA